jgi:hypothetical protein
MRRSKIVHSYLVEIFFLYLFFLLHILFLVKHYEPTFQSKAWCEGVKICHQNISHKVVLILSLSRSLTTELSMK